MASQLLSVKHVQNRGVKKTSLAAGQEPDGHAPCQDVATRPPLPPVLKLK